MKHRIHAPADDQVNIDVKVQDADKAKLLDGLKQCQSGQCGCPTQEYEKLKTITVASDKDGVHIQLNAKSNAEIDTGEVEKCLDWMKGQMEKE